MNFLEAVEQRYRKNKTVVSGDLKLEGNYNHIQIYNLKTQEFLPFATEIIIGTDWEIVEEKQTLADKRTYYGVLKEAIYEEKDVKEALKEFIDKIVDWDSRPYKSKMSSDIRDMAKEIFGERLL